MSSLMKMPLRRLNWYQRVQRLEGLRIEDLDAVVRAVGHEQAALRVERQAVRLIELAFEAGAPLAELLDELAGLVELDQARVRRRRGLRPRGCRRSDR